VPVDHLLIPEAEALPALVVVRLANGFTHFVVVWRRHGRFVQVMDPAIGRRWPTWQRFLGELYIHTLPIPAATWRAWAGTPEFLGPLQRRWALLGIAGPAAEHALEAAVSDQEWYSLATLDATTRMTDAIVRAGGLGRGRPATRLFAACYDRARHQGAEAVQIIPEAYWTVRPAPPAPDGEEQVLLRGAVLVRVRGPRVPDWSQQLERTLLHIKPILSVIREITCGDES
jgi:ATP-binding cassette subfamily B protein